MDSTSACLGEQELLALAAGELTGDAARRGHDHIDGCPTCRRVLAGVCTNDARAVPLAAGALVDRYVIREPLGMGGMGVIYSAHDPELDREVALKLVRGDAFASGSREEMQARLVREARTIARLSHENIVAVFDAGRHDGAVWVAMELVSGFDLGRWLDAEPRSATEVCAVLVAAGRGLAAAHVAGLVHRDVKPANVLVGHDGRVRVGDFGLARLAIAGDVGVVRVGDLRVTRTGALAGTPAYMAPEQFEGTATPASDQFSFCATAYEALYGTRPFPGTSIDEIRTRMRSEPEPPRTLAGPAAWRRALVRGLAFDPAARHASMQALLAQLAARPRRRARYVAGVLGLVAASVSTAWVIARQDAASCPDPTPLLAGVWDASVARAVEARLASTPAVWDRVRRDFEGYAAAWLEQRGEACRSARELPPDLYERRLACLEQRRVALRGVTVRLANGTVDAERALRAGSELPALADCTAPTYRSGLADGEASPRAHAWQDLELARADFIVEAHDEAAAKVDRVMAVADAQADRALRAEALVLRGRIAAWRSQLDDAVRDLTAGVELAGELGAHDLRIEGLTFLANVLQRLGRLAEADSMLSAAEAALRDTPDPEHELGVAASRGTLLGRRSRYAEAATQFERVLAIESSLHGESSPKLVSTLQNLAVARGRLGEHERSLALVRRAYEIERVLGDDNPKVAMARSSIGVALSDLGRYDEALAELVPAVDALRAAHQRPHLDVAVVEGHIAVVLLRQRRLAEAVPHQTAALEIRQRLTPAAPETRDEMAKLASALVSLGRVRDAEPMLRELLSADLQQLGERHVRVAEHRLKLANALGLLGRADEALRELAAVRAVFVEVFTAEHHRVAEAIAKQAEVERRRKRFRAALALDREAATMLAKTLPPEHVAHADILAAIALDQLGLGAARAARSSIEEAMRRRSTPQGEDLWVLARVLWATGERERALELARDVQAGAPPNARGEIDAWLAEKHPR